MSTMPKAGGDPAAAREAISRNPFWYHVIEVAPGVRTPGFFDLQPTAGRLPWPDIRGKRCLDIGTYDGFFAFELERRGADEVVATDIADHTQWDWPVRLRRAGAEYQRYAAGPRKGTGFEIARGLLGSSATLEQIDVYDLSPVLLGQFDVVVCGSLLLHLRDPLRALNAIRSVCRGWLLCTNQVELALTVGRRSRPVIRLDGTSDLTQWWLPGVAGHRQMVRAGGFDIERESRIYSVHFGPGHPSVERRPRRLAEYAVRTVMTGNDGVPHHAVLARPSPQAA